MMSDPVESIEITKMAEGDTGIENSSLYEVRMNYMVDEAKEKLGLDDDEWQSFRVSSDPCL